MARRRSLISRSPAVRKHRAPKGALRLMASLSPLGLSRRVRKHRAPKGALRRACRVFQSLSGVMRQKAPSAKRCIKTPRCSERTFRCCRSQKVPSAKRRIKTRFVRDSAVVRDSRQKAPSAKRRIKTACHRCGTRSAKRVRKYRAPKGALRHRSVRRVLVQS